MDSAIEKIRASVSLFDVWRDLDLPGIPRIGDLRSPFREDKRASFTIYQAKDHLRFHDHASGEGGDCIDLWAKAKGISVKDAIAEMTGSTHAPAKASDRPPEALLAQNKGLTADPAILWPENLMPPTEDECRQLGALRGLSPEAFFLAGRLGTLLMGDQRGQRLWITTDARMRSAARRRLDGKVLDLIGKKSAAPLNSPRDWIIGTQTTNSALDQLKNILVVEGEGDYYAGLQLAIESEINFKVLSILGAGTKTFHPDCWPQFRSALVLIIPHNDRSLAGEKAAADWARKINASGAHNCFIQKLPVVADDLNDFLIQRPSEGQKLLKGFQDGTPGYSPA
jgi:hypothetical protein